MPASRRSPLSKLRGYRLIEGTSLTHTEQLITSSCIAELSRSSDAQVLCFDDRRRSRSFDVAPLYLRLVRRPRARSTFET
jgi:hypothetical protein